MCKLVLTLAAALALAGALSGCNASTLSAGMTSSAGHAVNTSKSPRALSTVRDYDNLGEIL